MQQEKFEGKYIYATRRKRLRWSSTPPWAGWRLRSQRGHLKRKLIHLAFQDDVKQSICHVSFDLPECEWKHLSFKVLVTFLSKCVPYSAQNPVQGSIYWAGRWKWHIKRSWSSSGETSQRLDLVYLLNLYSLCRHELGLFLLHWGCLVYFLSIFLRKLDFFFHYN